MAGKRTTKRNDASGTQSVATPETPPVESDNSAVLPEATVTVAAGPATVTLPADCRIAAQVALKADLLAVFSAAVVVLDGRSVERVDTAGLQLLTLFQRELDSRGGVLQWDGASDVLNEAAGLLGLSQQLKLPAAALA